LTLSFRLNEAEKPTLAIETEEKERERKRKISVDIYSIARKKCVFLIKKFSQIEDIRYCKEIRT